ncbi:hypothetical protein ABZ345_34065 [Lentzea sp. NPDC005914]|uniref:hypothetical protein n=1 Tax=Lentzea sp. NPDC005914 TaxID=3154572 RepID=UPI0033CD5A5C
MPHDRFGERVEPEETDALVLPFPEPPHDERCVDGWIDRDAAVPCLHCKPHLARIVRRRRGRSPPTSSRTPTKS